MINIKSAPVLLIGLTAALPAHADLTAQEAWDSIVSYSEAGGQEITGDVSQSGRVMTIENVKTTIQIPEGGGSVTVTLGEITLTEQSDGSVLVGIPDEMSPDIELGIPGAPPDLDLGLTMTQSGYEVVISGDPGDVVYNYAADEIVFAMPTVSAGGQTVEVNLVGRMTGLNGSYTVKEDTVRTVAAKGGADSFALTVAAKEPGGQGIFDLDVSLGTINSSSTSSMPLDYVADGNPINMLKAGVIIAGRATVGSLGVNAEFADAYEQFALQYGNAGVNVAFSMGNGGVSFNMAESNLKGAVSGSEIPFPRLTWQATGAEIGVAAPVLMSEEDKDIAIKLALSELQVEETLWNMVDPAGQLSHDPVSFTIDLEGEGHWLIDISDPSQMGAGLPGMISSVMLKELTLDAVGALLEGSGGFTFDFTDMRTIPGVPRPEGSAMFKLEGGNGLLDTLVAMGLVPEEQAMGIRMMTGMFAKPGDGPDTLESEIEVNSEGHVLANGQRLR